MIRARPTAASAAATAMENITNITPVAGDVGVLVGLAVDVAEELVENYGREGRNGETRLFFDGAHSLVVAGHIFDKLLEDAIDDS